MPVYHPNIRISDCWGSAGEVTFYHRDGRCYWRARDRHAFSGTSAQFKALDVHRRALERWRIVPDNIKEKWNEFASVVEPHKPPFDGSSYITGLPSDICVDVPVFVNGSNYTIPGSDCVIAHIKNGKITFTGKCQAGQTKKYLSRAFM